MTFFTTKTPTKWIAPSGQGFIKNVGDLKVVENVTQLSIVDNATLLPVATTPIQWTPKNVTTWSSSGV